MHTQMSRILARAVVDELEQQADVSWKEFLHNNPKGKNREKALIALDKERKSLLKSILTKLDSSHPNYELARPLGMCQSTPPADTTLQPSMITCEFLEGSTKQLGRARVRGAGGCTATHVGGMLACVGLVSPSVSQDYDIASTRPSCRSGSCKQGHTPIRLHLEAAGSYRKPLHMLPSTPERVQETVVCVVSVSCVCMRAARLLPRHVEQSPGHSPC
jgi:hypothetical protein